MFRSPIEATHTHTSCRRLAKQNHSLGSSLGCRLSLRLGRLGLWSSLAIRLALLCWSTGGSSLGKEFLGIPYNQLNGGMVEEPCITRTHKRNRFSILRISNQAASLVLHKQSHGWPLFCTEDFYLAHIYIYVYIYVIFKLCTCMYICIYEVGHCRIAWSERWAQRLHSAASLLSPRTTLRITTKGHDSEEFARGSITCASLG